MVGNIPRGWRLTTLGDLVCLVRNGTTASQISEGTPFPVTRIETIADGIINRSRVGYLKQPDDKYLLKHGDILYSHINSLAHIGKIAFFDQEDVLYHGMNLMLIRGSSDLVFAKFLFSVLASEYGRAHARRECKPAINQVSLAQTQILALPIMLPPLPEQRRIAAILDAADEAIRAGERVIAKLRQVKAGALHDLLTCGVDAQGRLRNPRAHPEQFKDSPLGRIPREWEISRIIDISVGGISNGFFKKPELVGSGYTLINVLDLYQDFGIDLGLVERVRASEQEQQKYAVQAGDCFFTRSSLNLSGIAHCNIIREVTEPTLFECHLMRVRPNQKMVVPEFVALWCRSSWAHRYLMAQAKQVTMTTIAQPDLAPMLVPLPSLAEQTRIAAILDAHDARLRAEEAAVAKLRQVKAGLMEDLLTGRVRSKAL
ncbi:MAG: Type-1 restriction enzyme EcoKI specificity protein [Chloroflexi bacterium ADurb.Bin360]|nr:MAG: Type-1 restriction enzyme EcoKI specificity protein [Chloroflexi bacterium ADurb.Bin360]